MVKLLKKKIHSNRGASMILALALFLICTMVSSVIIAAASTGISRNAQRTKQQIGYLAIGSASDLIMEELENLEVYVGKNIEGRYGCQDCTVEGYIEYKNEETGSVSTVNGVRLDAEYTDNPLDKNFVSNPLDDGHLLIPVSHDPYVYAVTDGDKTNLDGVLGEMFQRGCTQVFATGSSYTENMTISLSNSDERMPDVTCLFTMDEEYNVSFQLTTAESDYSLVITAVAVVKVSDITESTDDSDEHTIYYKKFDEATGSYTSVATKWAIPIEVITTTTEISWSGSKVEKGVLSQ